MDVSKCFLVSVDIRDGDNAVLLVGEKINNVDVKVINAFSGEDALELYKKLTTVKEKKK